MEEFQFYGVKGGTEGYVDPRILPLKYGIFRTVITVLITVTLEQKKRMC